MIAVENLQFTYPGTDHAVLSGLGFSVRNGEVYGLLGPSGAGKSTTQMILMGLLRGFSGSVSLFGQPIGTSGRGFYERIGVSFELPSLYLRLTARENLTLFSALYQKPCRPEYEVLGLVGLQDDADERVERFSKGMKMRLNLARALLHDPELLFLDEPTAGQDPARARITRELILSLKAEGRTVFLTTHNMAEAEQVCDRVGFLAGGTIPVEGAPADLKRAYGKPVLDVGAQTDGTLATQSFDMAGLAENAAFLDLLRGGSVVSMHSREASLEDVFIAATGGARKP